MLTAQDFRIKHIEAHKIRYQGKIKKNLALFDNKILTLATLD